MIKSYFVKYKIFKLNYVQNFILLNINKEVKWQLLQYYHYLPRVTIFVFKLLGILIIFNLTLS